MTASLTTSPWKDYEKIIFRFVFIYFIIQVVPLDWKYYKLVFSIDWTNLYYGDIFNLSRYYPKFVSGPDTYWNWVIAGVLAAVGTGIWTVVEKSRKSPDYDNLYYWLRVILRYRLAFGVITYGFLKVFLLQAPYPSLSNLNSNYGDYTAWKIFLLSLGAAPIYQVFLGIVEVVAGLLLLYRQTSTIGAFIILCFTGNVWLSNLAYEGGEHIYSLYLTGLAAVLFWFDAKRLTNLLSFEKPTEPNRYNPSFSEKWLRTTRLSLKSIFILLVVFTYGVQAYNGYRKNPHHVPQAKGLKDISGLYNVKEFVLNGDTLPYSNTSPIRWKDVVFEKWATVSVRSNRPVLIDSTNTEEIHREDKDRNYEVLGTTGRHYYSYEFDSVKNTLTLHNKNKNYAGETLVLNISRPDSSIVKLSGINENKDTVNITLERRNKKYLLIEGRRKPQKL